eukprot:365313-Chlamydomonas_euryale.AAC.45
MSNARPARVRMLALRAFECGPCARLASVAARLLRPEGAPGTHFARAPPGADVCVADALALPYRAASCDAALCIAVLHHMSSVERRSALLAELLRLLVQGGRALVTVWATEQVRNPPSSAPTHTLCTCPAFTHACMLVRTYTRRWRHGFWSVQLL